MEQKTIFELVREMEQNFITGNIQVSKYVNEDPYEDINKIEAYLNSKHISGELDALGREKPFFNIVLASRNIWFRATDLDRKNIKLKPSKSTEVIPAFIGNILIQNWMKKENFGQFLNNWGLDLASYNSSIVKFVNQDGNLYPMVIPWTRVICDFINFNENPVIEVLELTPSQLKQRKNYDKEMVKNLLDTVEAREMNDKTKKDNNTNYIKLYEIHGNLPLSYITDDEKDEETFAQQMQVVSFVEGKNKGEWDDFILYKGKEKQSPYLLTSLLPNSDSSISLNGSVKNLFDAQWMQNHTVKLIKDQLDLASKIVYQTSDPAFSSQNALLAIENGDILIHQPNQPLTQMANNSHDITALQNYGEQWKALAQEITSTPDIMRGQNMPSGTAYRQAAIIQKESYSNFEIMTENKGLALEQMLRNFVIPYIKTKLNHSEEIVAILQGADIKKIDTKYIKNKAVEETNKQVVQNILNNKPVSLEEQQVMVQQQTQQISSQLSELGNVRFLKPSEIKEKTWQDMFKDFEWEIECEITGENEDKNIILTTLTNLFQTIVSTGGQPLSEKANIIFNKILETSGVVSPLELETTTSQEVVGAVPTLPVK